MKKRKVETKFTKFINRYHKLPGRESNKLAYLAGIIDGEGHIKIEKWGTIRLIVGMTDKATIYWICKNFGGKCDTPRRLKSGKIFYVWRMNNPFNNLKLMLMLYPFMITKKKQVFKALINLTKKLKDSEDFSTLEMFKHVIFPEKG